jgi:putative hydrolase
MTDNLFDRLADLLRSPGPVNWRLAREIAESVAGPAEPIEPALVEEYTELAATAARLVDQATPLDASSTTVIVGVQDRRGWAAANVESLAYVAEPMAEKLSAGPAGPSPLAVLGPALLGMQVGSTVGFLSHRVLGTFDAGFPAAAPTGTTFVVPNVEQLAINDGLDARQVRLWVALHEVVHQAELSIPWVHERLVMLVHEVVEKIEIDHEAIQRRFEALQDPDELRRLMEEPEKMGAMFRGDVEPAALDDMRALVAIIDGYAEKVVTAVGAGLVPQASRVRAAFDARRTDAEEGEAMLQSMAGLSLDPADYRLGLDFVVDVERRWGPEAPARIWEGPDAVPTLAEMADPVGWAARVLL